MHLFRKISNKSESTLIYPAAAPASGDDWLFCHVSAPGQMCVKGKYIIGFLHFEFYIMG